MCKCIYLISGHPNLQSDSSLTWINGSWRYKSQCEMGFKPTRGFDIKKEIWIWGKSNKWSPSLADTFSVTNFSNIFPREIKPTLNPCHLRSTGRPLKVPFQFWNTKIYNMDQLPPTQCKLQINFLLIIIHLIHFREQLARA